MKKLTAILLSLTIAVLTFGLAGCGAKKPASEETQSDLAYVKKKGSMTIGITIFEPMNYYDATTSELVGFETEFTNAVCEKLGVKADFKVIDWDTKETELDGKTIDVIWNGFTVTDERRENMDFSKSYMFNKQCLVVKAADAANYKTTADFDGKSVVAEAGSAGVKAALADTYLAKKYVGVQAQSDSLLEVKSGTSDAAVLDYVMAKASVGEGTSYSDLAIVDGIDLAYEEYAVGCRKDSDIDEAINGAIDELISDGTLLSIAEKYDLTESLILK